MKFRHSLLAGIVLAAFALPALAQDDGILVYNAQHEDLTQAWADAFTAETGIKVTIRQGSDLEVGNQILQEGANSPADVFLTENSPAMVLVDNAGLFDNGLGLRQPAIRLNELSARRIGHEAPEAQSGRVGDVARERQGLGGTLDAAAAAPVSHSIRTVRGLARAANVRA